MIKSKPKSCHSRPYILFNTYLACHMKQTTQQLLQSNERLMRFFFNILNSFNLERTSLSLIVFGFRKATLVGDGRPL